MVPRWMAVLMIAAASAGAGGGETVREFRFGHENVLGTSLDLTVLAPSRLEAEQCEKAVLGEIGRLEKIFSTYDPSSEISRLNASPREEAAVSVELGSLLADGARWQERTKGALNLYMGDLIDLWRREAPAPGEIEARVERLQRGGFRVVDRSVIQRLGPGMFSIDAIAKGRIVDRALAAAREAAPSMKGILVDIGGDLRVWGGTHWVVGIADPRDAADNAAPLTHIRLENRAIATSGGYARRRPHLIDPRTGRPAGHVLSATAVAPDAATADALATALCVMKPEEGLEMVDGIDGAACFIVDRAGRRHRSAAWETIEISTAPAPPVEGEWPDGYRVSVTFTLVDSYRKNPPTGMKKKKLKFKRHYVAIWVEDKAKRPVKLLALWLNKGEFKYIKDQKTFWARAGTFGDEKALKGMSRATRPAGTYTVRWDGTDRKGKPVPRSTYTIHIDINRENGPPKGKEHPMHTQATITCGSKAAKTSAPDKIEVTGVTITYGKDAGR